MPLLLDYPNINSSSQSAGYAWTAVDGTAITTADFAINNKAYEVGLMSLFIYFTGGTSPPTSVAVALEYKIDEDGTYYGTDHSVQDDDSNTSFTVTASTAGQFEARLDTQNWWKFGRAARIKLTPTGSGDMTINTLLVTGI